MTTGMKLGGPVANPIRTMLDGKNHEGVIFECDSEKRAETTRYAAIMLKRRNGYDYRTSRRGNDLLVYRNDADPFELRGAIRVSLRKEV